MGIGMGLSRMNPNLFDRPSELMFKAYYQAHLFAATFLQPTVTYIPTPGLSSATPGALATTLRLTVLFRAMNDDNHNHFDRLKGAIRRT